MCYIDGQNNKYSAVLLGNEEHDVEKGQCLSIVTSGLAKSRLFLQLTKYALNHENIWGSRRIPDLGNSCRWVIGFTPRPLYHRYPLDRKLGGHQNRSLHCELQKHQMPLPRIEPRSLSIPVRSRSYTDCASPAHPALWGMLYTWRHSSVTDLCSFREVFHGSPRHSVEQHDCWMEGWKRYRYIEWNAVVHYATSQKIAGSRPDEVNEFFQLT
jgi:hypothetical protein